MEKLKEVKAAFIRFLVGTILLINAILIAKGMNPIPFDETIFTETMSYIITGLAEAYLWWWKNNNVTKKAIEAQEFLSSIKKGGAE